MTATIATDNPFSPAQRELLAALAGLMIPADGELPSAADPSILGATCHILKDKVETTEQGLTTLRALAEERFSQSFEALTSTDQLELVATLREQAPAFITAFEAAVAACYYRDDRVLRALDMPARAPFPEGNAVKPTDWSLLDPVRQRAPFYRNV